MQCFHFPTCDCPDLGEGSPVLFLCNCLVSICHRCAWKQLASSPTRDPNIYCPKCQHHGMLCTVNKAWGAETLLVSEAFTRMNVSCSDETQSCNIITLQTLQTCLARLRQSMNCIPNEEHTIDDDHADDDTKHALYLRYCITELASSAFPDVDVLHPSRLLRFPRNMVLKRYLLKQSQICLPGAAASPPLDVQRCSECSIDISTGQSVQLKCNCEVNLCRNCALRNIGGQEDTFHLGINCPTMRHHISRGVLQNIDYVKKCEEALVDSALFYLTRIVVVAPGHTSESPTAWKRCNRMIKMYNSLGYHCTLTGPTTSAVSKTTTVHQLRLEVARLEELRLNSVGLLSTYSLTSSAVDNHTNENATPSSSAGNAPIGFLHALGVKRNVFLEHLYLNVPAEIIAVPSPHIAALQAQTALILRNLQALNTQSPSQFNLMDKFTLLAMLLNESASDLVADNGEGPAGAGYTRYAAQAIVDLVAKFLQGPVLNYQYYFGAHVVTGFVSPVLYKFTVNEVAIMMHKLQVTGIVCVQTNGREKTAYSLGCNWRVLTANLDPAHRKILQRHMLSTGTTLPTPAAARSSVETVALTAPVLRKRVMRDTTPEEGELECDQTDVLRPQALQSECTAAAGTMLQDSAVGAHPDAKRAKVAPVLSSTIDASGPSQPDIVNDPSVGASTVGPATGIVLIVHTPAQVVAQVNALESTLLQAIQEADAARQELSRQKQRYAQLAVANDDIVADLQHQLACVQKNADVLSKQQPEPKKKSENSSTLVWAGELGEATDRVQVLEKKLFAAKRERSEAVAAQEALQRTVTVLQAEIQQLKDTNSAP